MRMTATGVIMAQLGMLVPAASARLVMVVMEFLCSDIFPFLLSKINTCGRHCHPYGRL